MTEKNERKESECSERTVVLATRILFAGHLALGHVATRALVAHIEKEGKECLPQIIVSGGICATTWVFLDALHARLDNGETTTWAILGAIDDTIASKDTGWVNPVASLNPVAVAARWALLPFDELLVSYRALYQGVPPDKTGKFDFLWRNRWDTYAEVFKYLFCEESNQVQIAMELALAHVHFQELAKTEDAKETSFARWAKKTKEDLEDLLSENESAVSRVVTAFAKSDNDDVRKLGRWLCLHFDEDYIYHTHHGWRNSWLSGFDDSAHLPEKPSEADAMVRLLEFEGYQRDWPEKFFNSSFSLRDILTQCKLPPTALPKYWYRNVGEREREMAASYGNMAVRIVLQDIMKLLTNKKSILAQSRTLESLALCAEVPIPAFAEVIEQVFGLYKQQPKNHQDSSMVQLLCAAFWHLKRHGLEITNQAFVHELFRRVEPKVNYGSTIKALQLLGDSVVPAVQESLHAAHVRGDAEKFQTIAWALQHFGAEGMSVISSELGLEDMVA